MVSKITIRNRNKILKCLAEAKADGTQFLWLRSIARRTGINLGTVNWIVYRYLYPDYIDFPHADELIEQGLKIRPIMLRDEIFEKMTGVKVADIAEGLE